MNGHQRGSGQERPHFSHRLTPYVFNNARARYDIKRPNNSETEKELLRASLSWGKEWFSCLLFCFGMRIDKENSLV